MRLEGKDKPQRQACVMQYYLSKRNDNRVTDDRQDDSDEWYSWGGPSDMDGMAWGYLRLRLENDELVHEPVTDRRYLRLGWGYVIDM